jgi:undecaprenyl-diphosphatase
MSDIIKAVILGVVEGVTEFLPISSTGHLILVNQIVSFQEEFTKVFDIVIQLGAILAVVIYFRARLFPWKASHSASSFDSPIDLWRKILVSVAPALVCGALFQQRILDYLFAPIPVSLALLVGGLALIFLETAHRHHHIRTIGQLGYGTAFLIGVVQCTALFPGVSRSAATIIGAMLLGCSRVVAAEYSFFLAIPTLVAASVYSLFRSGHAMTSPEVAIMGVGFAVSFAVAYAVIAGFMRYVSTRDFKPFGYYRILLGGVVLIYYFLLR